MAEALVNEFTVNRPIEEAWPLICDLEKIAPCMPGAQLEEVEGDVYRGNVAIKLGSVAMKFKGEAQFVERDDTNHTATLRAEGRDAKGRGNAKADIDATAVAVTPTTTKVTINTNLSMAGRLAQIGRGGIMADVSKKLVGDFATNLNEMIDAEPTAATSDAGTTGTGTTSTGTTSSGTTSTGTFAPPTTPAAGGGAGATAAAADAGATTTTTREGATGDDAEPRVRKINGPAAEPIEVTSLAGPVLKRVVPAGLGIVALIWLLRKIF